MHFYYENLLTVYLHVKCTTTKNVWYSIFLIIISEYPNQESDLRSLNTPVL